MGDFVNAITTNLTSFFREAHHFEHLAKEVFVPFAKSREERLRVWSAGCSAGAEAYTIGMTLCENVPDYARRDCKILATDIDTNVLNTGRNGQYEDDWLEKIPANLHAKYVEKNRMSAKLRDLVTFNQLNLLENWPFKGKFDVIFCRNVLIYFDKPTQEKLFTRYADALKPDGFLYIGHSETMHNLCDRFKLIGKTTYQRVK
jgi:chemotaxis protein methyltransferase CheR